MDTLAPFHTYLTAQDCAALTRKGYLSDMEHFARWFEQTNGEPLTPQAITPSDIKEYRQFLLTVERYKANTVNRRLAAISAYARWALSTGQIHSDPTLYVKSVKQVANTPKWLDKSEQYALQRAIERDLQLSRLRYPKRHVTRRRDASITFFLLNTGLRLNELVSMRLDDLQLSDRKGSLLVQNGKGGKQRTIPLNAEARKSIQEWLAVRPKTKSDLVWIGVEGESNSLSGRAVQRILERYAAEAGLEAFTAHICRHTFAKNLANQDVGLEKIASLLGHSSLNTTQIYLVPDARDLEQAVGKLENY